MISTVCDTFSNLKVAPNVTRGASKAKQFNTDTKLVLKSIKCVLLCGNICFYPPTDVFALIPKAALTDCRRNTEDL